MFSIIVDEPYSSDYDECLDRASDELAQQARPTIVDTVKNMDEYDVIFFRLSELVVFMSNGHFLIYRKL